MTVTVGAEFGKDGGVCPSGAADCVLAADDVDVVTPWGFMIFRVVWRTLYLQHRNQRFRCSSRSIGSRP